MTAPDKDDVVNLDFGQVWWGGGIIPNNITEQFSHLLLVLARNGRYRNQNYYMCVVFVMLNLFWLEYFQSHFASLGIF